jgi:radical SAM family uncharacterized protein
VPLYSLESRRPLGRFDVLGFSLQTETCLTNVLECLDLAGVPLLAAERADGQPLIVGGGPVAFNPEPAADFFDVFCVGEGEEWVVELSELLRCSKGMPRRELLLKIAREIPGAYVPSLYEVAYSMDGRVQSVRPRERGVPEAVQSRVVEDLDAAYFPSAQVVPFVEIVHDRLAVEVMRGCANGCRFCQAGCCYRPVRSRSVEKVMELARAGYAATGWEEIGLSSLSISDYPELSRLLEALSGEFDPLGVSISVPSLRVGTRLGELARATSAVRKTGLTIAPETGSERLRAVVNKRLSNEELFTGVDEAYRAGYDRVKLYFMIGLPGETDEDVASIADICNEVAFRRKRIAKSAAKVNVTVSPFIPKAQTPFQWEGAPGPDELRRRGRIVVSNLRSRTIRASVSDPALSRLEGAISRGDRRVGKAILAAYSLGARFDAWSEHFKAELWEKAFAEAGLEEAFYAERARPDGEVLPWDHIHAGMKREILERERDAAREELARPAT